MISRTPYLEVSTKVNCGRRSIPPEEFRSAADAVRETAAAHCAHYLTVR
ncbi:hypothetical protein ACFWUQ_03960 [Streptomyces sp. NPDC058662]